VIIPNYALARINCINASNLFEICCRNECEGVLGQLEKEIGASTASPMRIAEIVSLIKTDSVQAPRKLPAALLGRLEDIAAHHGKDVPIHGRLFTQWLHHAFPLECPYPHEQGTTNRNAWSGKDETKATDEEMRKTVEADTCAVNPEGKVECADESTELPWNPTEELLTYSTHGERGSIEKGAQSGQVLRLLFMAFLAPLVFVALRGGKLGLRLKYRERMLLAALSLTAFFYGVGLLDGVALCVAIAGSLMVKLASAYINSLNRVGMCGELPMHKAV